MILYMINTVCLIALCISEIIKHYNDENGMNINNSCCNFLYRQRS